MNNVFARFLVLNQTKIIVKASNFSKKFSEKTALYRTTCFMRFKRFKEKVGTSIKDNSRSVKQTKLWLTTTTFFRQFLTKHEIPVIPQTAFYSYRAIFPHLPN